MRSMKIGVILDPLDSLRIYKDSTYAMMREATRRGHALFAMMPDALVWKDHVVTGTGNALALQPEEERSDWYSLGPRETVPLRDFDAVLMRKDPPFDVEYLTATWMLDHAVRQGARVFNHPRALRDHSEKLTIMQFSEFCVPTIVARMLDTLHAFIETEGDVILKPLEGMGGAGIFRVTRDDPNRNIIVETLSANGARTVMAQRYIPAIRDGDKRVLLIAGEPVPFCLARIPKPGETRGNLAVGGVGVARPLNARDLEIARALGPVLHSRGLLLVGLDIIGDFLTEVNVTSPTCFREITNQTGFDVASVFIDALERQLVAASSAQPS